MTRFAGGSLKTGKGDLWAPGRVSHQPAHFIGLFGSVYSDAMPARPYELGFNVNLFLRHALKRPPKEPDRVYPLVKDQEYACEYDWEGRSG